jgi:hypothetical protein
MRQTIITAVAAAATGAGLLFALMLQRGRNDLKQAAIRLGQSEESDDE